MLILTRHPGESVVITTADGDKIVITTLYSSRQGIKLGFDAPKNVQIDREEIYQRKHSAQELGRCRLDRLVGLSLLDGDHTAQCPGHPGAGQELIPLARLMPLVVGDPRAERVDVGF